LVIYSLYINYIQFKTEWEETDMRTHYERMQDQKRRIENFLIKLEQEYSYPLIPVK